MIALMKYDKGRGNVGLRDVPVPEVRDDDVLIEVKAAGICGSDIGFFEGENTAILHPPVVLGHEFAGMVAEVGAKVTAWKPGDRVVSDNTGHVCGVCYSCSIGDYLLCPERLGLGYGMDGGFTKYVRIDGDLLKRVPNTLFHIPEGVPFEHAAILDPAANAYRAVVQEGGILPGEIVAVFGVGALGLFSIQMAAIAGASEVIAIGLSADSKRFEAAQELGATRCIPADRENVAAIVRDLTGGEGVSLVIDAAGPSTVLAQSFHIIRNSGRIIKIGYDPKAPEFSLNPLLDKGISLKGHFGYDWLSWRNCIRLLGKGVLRMAPLITHTLSLSDWEAGFELTRTRKAVKVILEVE
jgi:threonine dehydrogenase-like Zn-dependent dehydrogenase